MLMRAAEEKFAYIQASAQARTRTHTHVDTHLCLRVAFDEVNIHLVLAAEHLLHMFLPLLVLRVHIRLEG